ncbi:hypothetical protein BCU33_013070 [Vibrio lentus]|uniref:hypothetical protein n=1 Tax=Vibrio lentus TaxID=136468 RepID=UPI00101AD0EC|nr:hypothetical protein [Vibrio lentus]MCC4784504.1 hypothetical protein [Vibrio lentus]TKG19621.1 hypothetical protein FCW05_09045 [Vibrio lentus]
MKFEQLEALTHWGEKNRTIRKHLNKDNIVNTKYRTAEEKINQALLDYSSGLFEFKKSVALKNNISVPTLIHHANLNGVEFVKKDPDSD